MCSLEGIEVSIQLPIKGVFIPGKDLKGIAYQSVSIQLPIKGVFIRGQLSVCNVLDWRFNPTPYQGSIYTQASEAAQLIMGVVSIQLPIKGVFIPNLKGEKYLTAEFQSNSLSREYLYQDKGLLDMNATFQSNSLSREYLYGLLIKLLAVGTMFQSNSLSREYLYYLHL